MEILKNTKKILSRRIPEKHLAKATNHLGHLSREFSEEKGAESQGGARSPVI
ncbi:hypothetical protein RND71_000049 [Anisodus tanguticus]|uniref:Uncharacterized protein n=1 Tax=Anisodus tanguticus TaxID=243964 RepID=A0AAE1VR05_9SOLA|nr:hypothetical protein RND71_000049 [Anisodus tanguticus]